MCALAHCRGEGTTFFYFHGGRAQFCFSNTRVTVGKIFVSQSVRVEQIPCEQFPLNKKMISMDFTLDLLTRAFFGRGDWEVCHCELGVLLVGSYSKTQVSSLGITRCRKSGILVTRSKSSRESNTRFSLCSLDKFFRDQFHTNFSHVKIFRNDSVDVSFR